MLPEVRKYLADALQCACSVENFTKGLDYSEFEQNLLLRSAVYYQFTIIGEALTQMRKLDDATFERISEVRRIVGFRNQVVHGYDKLQDIVTWQIIQDKLPILQQELRELLDTK